MKLPDTNVLLYAVNAEARQHDAAHDWLRSAFAAPAGVGLAWLALLGFLRISTNHRILAAPLRTEQALHVLLFWLSQARARVLNPTERHAGLLGDLLAKANMAGNLTNDAHLAALAMEHGATLGSFDRDFDRFEGLSFERLRP